MAKPICIIKVDLDADLGNGRKISIGEFDSIFHDRLPDYHVFVLPNTDYESPRDLFSFQVFYEKDMTEVTYNELKDIINKSLN